MSKIIPLGTSNAFKSLVHQEKCDQIIERSADIASGALIVLRQATDGTSNDALNRASFALANLVKAALLPEDWARAQLEARAIAIGLPITEARRTIAGAFKVAQPRNSQRARYHDGPG